jgi:hypothetical protein
MQKLVTIYLDKESYRVPRREGPERRHGIVEQHLEGFLGEGWTVKSIAGTGGGGDGGNGFGCGWIIALLEKN